jgi:hypothetical protein
MFAVIDDARYRKHDQKRRLVPFSVMFHKQELIVCYKINFSVSHHSINSHEMMPEPAPRLV